MVSRPLLYVTITNITADYLGPAADRFIARQVTNHLQKNPEDLTQQDLDELIDWIKLAISFLTDDEKMISEYINRLEAVRNRRRHART